MQSSVRILNESKLDSDKVLMDDSITSEGILNTESPVRNTGFPELGLNLVGLEGKGFHQEFMERVDEFSQSWRDEVEWNRRGDD